MDQLAGAYLLPCSPPSAREDDKEGSQTVVNKAVHLSVVSITQIFSAPERIKEGESLERVWKPVSAVTEERKQEGGRFAINCIGAVRRENRLSPSSAKRFTSGLAELSLYEGYGCSLPGNQVKPQVAGAGRCLMPIGSDAMVMRTLQVLGMDALTSHCPG